MGILSSSQNLGVSSTDRTILKRKIKDLKATAEREKKAAEKRGLRGKGRCEDNRAPRIAQDAKTIAPRVSRPGSQVVELFFSRGLHEDVMITSRRGSETGRMFKHVGP